MKKLHLAAAAGLLLATMGASTAAQADRGDRYHNGYHDNGRHNGWRNNHRRCHTEWRHHRRVQVCR